jgi:hypothetical protein
MTEHELNLRERIRAILTDTGEADPGIVADKVVAELSSRQLRPALGQTMRALVREVIRDDRGTAVTHTQPAPGQGRSRARAVAEAWRAHLRDRVFVGDTWRLLGDCTAADVQFLVDDRRRKAAELVATADRYDGLRAAMVEYGVERVVDLPDAVLAATLGDSE